MATVTLSFIDELKLHILKVCAELRLRCHPELAALMERRLAEIKVGPSKIGQRLAFVGVPSVQLILRSIFTDDERFSDLAPVVPQMPETTGRPAS